MDGFELRKRIQGSGAVIEIHGELDLAVADRLEAAIDETDEQILVIDLSGCEFLDSTGIAVIVRAHNDFEAEGRRLVATAPRQQVHRVLEVTGLTRDGLLVEDAEGLLG